MTTGPRWRLAILIALALISGSCSDDAPTHEAFTPTYDEETCPSDVQVASLAPLTCGYLTVLEDRSKPAGGTVRLFVVRTDPPDDQPAGVILGLDEDLGTGAALGAGAGAARTHSVVYQFNPRGTGRSEPSLACPEVDEVAVAAAEATASSPSVHDATRAAVQACHDRLVADGIDPASYDLEQSAADIEDLREALGVDRWSITSQGTYSRYAIEAARRSPEHITYLFFDSPQFPGWPDPQVAVRGLDETLSTLASACAADPTCNASAPDLRALLSDATKRLDATPASFETDTGPLAGSAGRPVTVVVDGAKLLRAVRAVVGGDGPAGLADLPATIAAAARGEVSEQLATTLGNDGSVCAGYRPICPTGPEPPFSLGVYLTSLCRDQMPFLDPGALTDATNDDPALQVAYGDNPYVAACEAWDVPPADDAVAGPPAIDVPTLIVTGQLDSFSPTSIARQAAEHLSSSTVLEIPWQTHNVMGFGECQISIRNAWILSPDQPPADTECLDALQAMQPTFATPAR